MKVLVLSDIHSNICALKAIWEREGYADKILIAGDLVDYGPFPSDVIHWARERGALAVSGNHDKKLIGVYRCGGYRNVPPDAFCWVHDNCLQLNNDDVKYLESLPEVLDLEIDGFAYRMRHLYRGYEEVSSLREFEALWNNPPRAAISGAKGRRMIFGHTHRRCVHYLADDLLWMNPGSVSYRRPDDNSKSAHYAVITDGEISLGAVEYDRSPLLAIVRKYKGESGMSPDELQDALFFFGDAAEPGHR